MGSKKSWTVPFYNCFPVLVNAFFGYLCIVAEISSSQSMSSSTSKDVAVSFYGSSHVNTRLQEAKSTSDIYFRLRTRRSDSMLFLAAGRTDYCLLVLDAGRLKVHINLGAGETEISSEAPFLLNDMKWHTVNLTRRGSQLTIQIDDHLTKSNLPTRFHELNIHFGVWLGGLNGFTEIFLGNLPSFRGCMSQITYNSEDVLQRAKTQGEINGISWNCSEEFEAIASDPFNFNSLTSYVISRLAIPRQGTSIKMNILANKLDGLIFYVTGLSSRPDFLALQLKEGKIYFIVELGTGQVHLQSTINITDNQWHSISLQVTPNLLSLIVDNVTWSSDPPVLRGGGSRQLDVSEMVYLGGVEDVKKSKVRSLGLIDQSFMGCIQHVNIDGISYGLPQVDVSRDITKGCSASSSSEDCYISSKTTSDERRVKTRKCKDAILRTGSRSNVTAAIAVNKSNGTTIVKLNGTQGSDVAGAKGSGSPSNALEVITIPRDVIRVVAQTSLGELEIMRLSPVQVAEGDSVIITPRHLAMTLDLSKFGIRESGVLFRVSKPPQEGRIEVTTRTTGSSSSTLLRSETFALLDVGAGRVRYFHSGTESSKDSIELVLRLVQTTGFLLPAYLQDERTFTLPVDIAPVNDPPEIRLVPGGVLRLAERTKIRLSPGVITALDPDTPPEDLQFSLMPLALSGEKRGTLELSPEFGKSIQTFTQEDLENKHVWYVDQGESSSKLAFRVSDGSSISSTTVLRIETFPLRIVPEVNTGLEIANTLGATTFITSNNLSFTSNAMDQGLVIEYHVVKGPKAGLVQLKRVNGQWASADHFTQQDLVNKGLRYLLQRPSNITSEDEFSFHVSLADVKLPTEFRLRLKIVSLRLEKVGTNLVILNGTTESLISTRQLDYRTFPVPAIDSSIKYHIVREPVFGFLSFRLQVSPYSNSSGSTNIFSFTQADVASKRIFYQFRLTPYSSLNDNFLFNISTSSTVSGPFECQIHHFSQRKSTSFLIVKPLTVTEGMKEFLTNSLVRSPTMTKEWSAIPLYFNVTSPPQHGSVGILTSQTSAYTLSFSTLELENGLIYYQHDSSETSSDKVVLIVWNTQGNFVFEVKMNIIVIGVNNKPPVKDELSSQAIHVVFGQSRALTKSMLNYIDQDWDSGTTQIKYKTLVNSPGQDGIRSSESFIGSVYDKTISLKRPIFSWTQSDVNDEKLVFVHEGKESQGFITFSVTDSKFTVNGTLEISAGAPYVQIVNTTTLAAKQRSIQQLTDASLRVDTNMDVDQQSIVIRLVGGPQHGIIRVNGKATQNFTLGEVKNGLVFYENTETTDDPKDYFQFKAIVGNVESNVNEFDISIYPQSYWTPLNVVANESVLVNENSSAVISQNNLQIMNPRISSTHIVYTLTKLPKHGYLAIDPKHSQDEPDAYVTMWDQTVINEGRLRYVQSEPNKTIDSMNFDVTNGVLVLRDLKTDFIVIPATLLLASLNIRVNEGGSTSLNITHLNSAQNYFNDKLGDIKILNGPKSGTLMMISETTEALEVFSYNALQDGKIIYSHDGSETLHDQFIVVGQTIDLDTTTNGIIVNERADKRYTSTIRISQPLTVHIDVIPSNDQVPRVMNNTGTWVWIGSHVLITNKELAAIDDDSDGNTLIFYIVDVVGGFLATVSLPSTPLLNFTQDMINNSQIIFVHKGENVTTTASFEFEVSDGLNEASKETFRISIRRPELIMYEGRTPVAVFPLTQSPIKPENLLVRSNDGREIVFQATVGPILGQLLIGHSDNTFLPISSFTQTDVNNGKVFYQHLKPFHGQTDNDFFRLTANSKFTEPLHNITVDINISVRGAALGGLQRYLTVQPLLVKEGSQVTVTSHNVNLSSMTDFINAQQRGSMWRSGMPTLKLVLAEMPKHGWLVNTAEGYRLQYNDEVLSQLLSKQSIKYFHDDSETTEDDIGFALWLWTNETTTSTWLLNITLPITIVPVNDLPFQITIPKGNVVHVVQGHWRKLSRNDLLTSDPDTSPAHIVYEVLRLSHGRLILLSEATLNPSLSPLSLFTGMDNTYGPKDIEYLRELPSATRFTQADVDTEKLIFYHSGPVSPILIDLRVSDGQFPALPLTLTIPVQPLLLQASQSQANPLRIQQGNSVMTLSVMNLPASTNGHLTHLVYNVTRLPLHGKLFLKDGTMNSASVSATLHPASQVGRATVTFTHYELSHGELAYVQTDLSVANDSFEVKAYFNLDLTGENGSARISTSWLVNVVSVPLLKRVKEVRSFIKGFAVGGIIAPDEADFSATVGIHTTLNLAVLDAAPLAVVTGANPLYEILLPPKFGHIFKIPSHYHQNTLNYGYMKDESERQRRALVSQNSIGRVTSRFSHEDIRRGSIIYSPSSDLIPNDILPIRLTSSSRSSFSSSMADEFVFKVLAPGVQPALGVAKFNIRLHDGTRYYDDKTHNQIISDGSTDPASKAFPNGESSLRELIMGSKESLITFGVIIIGIVTISTFIIVGIRCTCSKESNNRHCHPANNPGGNNVRDPKCNGGIGSMDAYTTSTACTHLDQSCQSDSDCSSHIPHNSHHGAVLRPLLVSTLSPRVRHKVGNNSRTTSESGSWTSSGMRNDIPTPSVPQCRVTPLCSTICDGSSAGSDSGGGGNSMVMCPLLPPAPVCDTFGPLPEEIDPPEQYGFTYGSLTSSLPQPEVRDQHTETMPFSDFQFPANSNNSGTLRRNNVQQNQYWV